ncbi:TonB-dependent receptor [uncultured Prevotella sp.]|uniref:SusC/RagA family TonB-linked outer membrane protein n=1 Tax=uncultured Prevotella sp. TaxID=159272 RepID=UPI002803F6DE|nr:TonB-dependent receptor [uncultured Prevotella sp.]
MFGKLKTFRLGLIAFMLFLVGSVSAQSLKGNVKDSNGEPIIGATIQEKGSKNMAVTDLDGNFSIGLSGGKQITVSYIGMKTATVNVGGKSSVNVVMEDEATTLNDVVVIGYGTVKKKDLTGAVTSVSAKDLANIPVSTASEAIQGKMAGVTVTTTEGSPDAEIKIRVRGGGSLSQDNSPLYIVDGFPVSSISDIAPNDIESIDVLKDASSTAIYGARGANGVVIVTTKSGKEGKVQVNFGASLGIRKVMKEIEVFSPYDYAKYQYETQYGKDQEYGDWRDMDIWKSVAGSNWQDELFGRTGLQQIYNLSVSGGSKETKFNVSYSRTDDKSIMMGSDFTKDNINAKLNTKLNKWLSLDFNARLAYSVVNGLNSGGDTNDASASNSIINKAITYRPVEPLNASSEDDADESSNTDINPYDRMTGTYKQQRRFRQDYNAGLNWKPFKHFTFRSEFGYTWRYENTDQAWDKLATRNDNTGAGAPKSRFSRVDVRNWRNANTLTYDTKNAFAKGDRLNVLVGQEWSSSLQKNYYISVIDFPSDFTLGEVLAHQGAGKTQPAANTIGAKDNMASFFGRVNYTYADKYLLTATFRADGSSKFASGNRWGFFPAVALGWRISEENFMKHINWLSNLKLRLSYGEAGNNRIPSGSIYQPFSFPNDYSKLKEPYFDGTMGTVMELGNTKSNTDLKWETTITRNVGLDFGFLNSRINGTLDFYWNTTKDLLMKSKISSSSGYSYMYKNFGQTSNKGVELAVNAAIIEKKNFTLNVSANISYNKNKIDKLNTGAEWDTNYGIPDAATTQNFRVVEGGSLGEVWGYRLRGYYTAYDAEKNPNGELVWTGSKWALREGLLDKSSTIMGSLQPGSPKLKVDENGDVVKEKLGNTIAPWAGGFGFNATFYGFDASVFFNYQFGNKIVNGTKMGSSFFHDTRKGYNLNSDFLNRYSSIDPANGLSLANPSNVAQYYEGGEAAVIARLNELNANASIYNPVLVTKMYLTDYFVESASFLRLQNLTVGYTLPKKLLKNIFLNNVRFYFTGYNLLTITGYSGNDPEVDSSSKKSPMSPGVDYASYPKSRLYVFGVNVSF